MVFDSKLPKPVNDWFPVNWFVACIGFITCVVPILLFTLFKLLLAKFVLICAADVGDVIVGWIGNAAAAVAVACVFTGLCNFNWFIDNVGPDDFDFVESKLSKSILMGPAFDQVGPTILNVVGFDWPLLSFRLVDIACNKVVFVGCNILAEYWKEENRKKSSNHFISSEAKLSFILFKKKNLRFNCEHNLKEIRSYRRKSTHHICCICHIRFTANKRDWIFFSSSAIFLFLGSPYERKSSWQLSKNLFLFSSVVENIHSIVHKTSRTG